MNNKPTFSTTNIVNSAPLWRRLGAMIYDTMLVLAIWMLVAFVILSVFGVNETQRVGEEIVVNYPLHRKFIMFSAMLMSAFIFFSWFWTHTGQTLGMLAWKIKIQNADGSAINLKQSLIRFMLAPLSFALLGSGYFFMLLNSQKKTLHDLASDSEVIQVKRK